MSGQFNNTISEDKMLGKEYILATYFLYMKRHDASRGVLKRRLHALLSAYNPDIREDWEHDFVFGNLIDEECSEEKLRMIEEIIGRKMYDDLTSPPTDIYTLRRGLFHALLKYRVKVGEISKTYDGVMECSVGFEFGIQFSRQVSKEIFSTLTAKVDRVLLLLLGDKYDEKVFGDKIAVRNESQHRLHSFVSANVDSSSGHIQEPLLLTRQDLSNDDVRIILSVLRLKQ